MLVTNIPYQIIDTVMAESDNSAHESEQREWVKHERKYSNSMWHVGYKQLDDKKWLIVYQDDASRFIVGFGVFDEDTEDHALQVLKKAISMHGKPASVLTGHGSQFYASEKEAAAKGATKFEKELVALGIRHVLARANRTQTNGKLVRFYGELQRILPTFIDESVGKTVRQSSQKSVGHVGSPFYSAGPTDPVTRLVHWHNYDRTHMSLGKSETPAQAFARKMPPVDRL